VLAVKLIPPFFKFGTALAGIPTDHVVSQHSYARYEYNGKYPTNGLNRIAIIVLKYNIADEYDQYDDVYRQNDVPKH